jgi:hypothetical protein
MTSTSRRTEFDDRAFSHRLAAEAYEAIRRH